MAMNKLLSTLLLATVATTSAFAQTKSCASFLKAQEKSDIIVPFRFTDEGKETPIEWGLDLAWLDEANVRTGIFYAGQDVIDIIRLSFQPTASVEEGSLDADQLKDLKKRADAVLKWCKKDISYNINDDHKSVDKWYNNASTSAERGKRWAKVIDLAIEYYKSRGITNLVSISPFNEPDYGWDQGYSNTTRKADFKAVCNSLRNDFDGKYDGVRMCGGNTLNDDKAYEWWNYLKDALDEGNTHQLAGSFDNYASFFQKVREYGHHATADELHNVMEAMVGVEYGMQTGIWWGTCEYARSQFMKATYQGKPGKRLSYAEHRNNWTSASVYRHANGLVQAFGGMSERQSYTTDYDFLALDRPVWYNGVRGREYRMHLPGGTGYQQGQSGAEVCIDVQSGEDVMPEIADGVYKIVNVNSGLVMGFSSKPTSGWTSVSQRKNSNTTKSMQWVVTHLQKSGDFSYYSFLLNTDNGMYLDLKDWNYNAGANVGVYPGDVNVLEQWYLQYAGNGAFYIRSRYSNKCLEVESGKTIALANIQMGEFRGETYQQWRLLPAKVTPDMEAPAAPDNLVAQAQNASVKLSWNASADKDILGYTILRSEDGADYYTLAKNISETEFIDNEVDDNVTYYYKVYADDTSLNQSEKSNVVSASSSNEKGEVLALTFDSLLTDASVNANHCAIAGDTVYDVRNDRTSISLNGTSNYVQLPYTVANHDEITISTWIYYRGGSSWQRIFDFGNGTDQYMFLTPNSGTGLSFAIKNGGSEQVIKPSKTLSVNKWNHVVITLGENGGVMYLNGQAIGSNENINIKPSDFKPVLNYIGKSQYANDPYLKGYIDDFRIYNYVLSPEEINNLTNGVESIEETISDSTPYQLNGVRATKDQHGIIIQGGKKIRK